MFCSFAVGLSPCLIIQPANATVKEQLAAEKYVVNNPDWSDEKFTQYYLENGILPATTPPSDSSGVLRKSDIVVQLGLRFPQSSSWYCSENVEDTRDVSAIFGGLPLKQMKKAL